MSNPREGENYSPPSYTASPVPITVQLADVLTEARWMRACLDYCDTAYSTPALWQQKFDDGGLMAAQEDLRRSRWVVRRKRIEVIVGHEEVYRRLYGGEMQQVQMVMWLSAVGRTSFTVGFEV